MTSTSNTTYTCGRCRQPLSIRVTPSAAGALAAQVAALGLAESQYDLLASQISTYAPNGKMSDEGGFHALVEQDATPLVSRKVVLGPPDGIQQQSALQRHFDTLSAHSEADHPLCTECSKAWFSHMSETVEEQKRLREQLLQYEKDVKSRKEELDARNDWLDKDTTRLEKAEKDLKEQLLQMEEQKDSLDEELRQLDNEEKVMESDEIE
jgi:beclin 1